MLALLADGKNENIWEITYEIQPGKWHFSPNHATIKTWKNLEIDEKWLENNLEKPGVGPFLESGDPVYVELYQLQPSNSVFMQ